MQPARLPVNEAARMAALRRYDILDTAPEDSFDDITRLASYICGTPIASMTLVDAARQWFKSSVGLDATETPRDIAFCAHTILSPDAMVVHDALLDERFVDNPLVTTYPLIRFYAGVPLITPDGHALGALCAIDRVPRELSHEQLEALQTLAKLVVQTMELRQSHRQLNELSKRLARVNEGKDRLFAMITHDLKSPVGGVLGMLELLSEEVQNMEMTQIQKYMQMLSTSTRGTFELMESLLQWSVFESGKMTFLPVALSMDEVTSSVFSLTRLAAYRKKVTLETIVDVRCHVLADNNMLRSVMQNLVSNAIKFTPAGGVVCVSYASVGQWVNIAVRDSGTGMSEEELRKALDHDDLHTTSGTTGEEGTGLGLKICRTFIEKHGGTLSATSQPGKGTTFTFTLPTATSPH